MVNTKKRQHLTLVSGPAHYGGGQSWVEVGEIGILMIWEISIFLF